jgi:hypothetical protein
MARKKTEIIFDVELHYILEPFGTSDGCDFDDEKSYNRYKKAHQDNSRKHLSSSGVRANFSCTIPMGKKTIGDLTEEIDGLRIERFIELCNDYIIFVKENSKPIFPDLVSDNPTHVECNWKNNFKFDKKNVVYRTNIYNSLDCKVDPESQLLDMLQQMVKEGYEEYINLRMHFNCWAYYIGEKPSYDFTVQELINHRRKQLNG